MKRYRQQLSRIRFIFALVVMPLWVFAQTDSLSIRQRIMGYPATEDYMILKGRRYLSDQLEKNHLDTVRMVMDYFGAEIDGYDYVSLWNVERILLYYRTKQYERLIILVNSLDSMKRAKYYPPDKQVEEVVTQQSIRDFDLLNRWIDDSDRSNEDKAFLKLLLISVLPDGSVGFSRKQNEKQAHHFRELYPQSGYNSIIRKYVAAEYGLNDFGFNLGLGGGYTFFNNKNLALNGCTLLNIGLIYKRWQLDMGIQGSFGKLLQDVPIEDWQKGERMTVTNFDFSLGYSVLDTKRWRITPFGGFAYNEIISGNSTDKKNKVNGYSPLLGVDFDLKLNPWHSLKYTTSTVAYTNLRVNYLPAAVNGGGKLWSGGMLLVTLSVAFDFHWPERIY